MSEENKNLNEQPEVAPVEKKEEAPVAKKPLTKQQIGIIAGIAAAVVVLIVVLALVLGGGKDPHSHSFVDGKCECGESDPNYVPPHTHSYVEGKCECGATDPSYVPDGPAVTEQEYKLGMGVIVGLNSSKTGTAQVDATVAVVVLDKDGKIVDCKIDAAQNVASLTDGAFSFTKLEKTKAELGYDYNMAKYGKNQDRNGDGKVLEWFEQAAAFEAWCIGKTVDEIANMATQTQDDGYVISNDEALLSAGCTIQITDFRDAVVKACNDEQGATFSTVGKITLGVAATSYDSESAAAEGDTEGSIKMYTDFGATALVDGKIVAALNDAIQPEIKFNVDGEITAKTFKGTKRELKEDYNMSKWGHSLVGNETVAEWYLQSAAFSKYVVGKTPAEVMAIPTQVASNGYIISGDDALLSAGCTMSIDAIMAVVAKSAGYVAPEKEYTLGMGVVVNLNSSKTGTAQVDATVATVVLDKDGKIVFVRIDAAQNVASLTDGEFSFTKLEKTKAELGYDYNMAKYGKNQDRNGDGIVLEWFEQAQAFEAWCIGKTVDEIANMATQTQDDGYVISNDEALLSAGCTIQITDFRDAVVKACNDEQGATFSTVGKITLGVAATSYDSESAAAEGDTEGSIKMYTDFGATALVDGKIVAALNDAIQPEIKFNVDGEITAKTFKGTKRELKEDYNMSKWGHSLVGNETVAEWYLQSAAFSAHVVGKTADQVKNMPTQTASNGYIISDDDALLSAGCTMSIDAIIDVVVESVEYAR